MAEASPKITIKLLVNTKTNRVLFAEAGKDFIDFLINLLSLPLATITSLLDMKNMVGSLGSLFESIENLNETYLQPNLNKNTMLKPKLQLNSSDTLMFLTGLDEYVANASRKMYVCGSYHRYVTDNPKARCPQCKLALSTELPYVAYDNKDENSKNGEGGGFVKGVITYMVMDDLVVTPMSTISCITMLNKFHVKEVATLTEKVVHLGMDELVIDTRKKKVLFAEASKDFVDLLFNLLALPPVATVITLLTKQEMVGCIGNLYGSVENLSDTCLQSTDNVDSILNPDVQTNCSTDFFLLLNKDVPAEPIHYYRCSDTCVYVCPDFTTTCPDCGDYMSRQCRLVPGPNVATTKTCIDNKVGYVKGGVTYMVMGDLVVKPMSSISIVPLLNKFNVKEVAALEEREVVLTMPQGVKLLKASLHSNMVLTHV